jgi:LysR family transcriptional regulator, glycine cleavage system transcriptional activator
LSREHPDISLRIYGEFHTLDKIRMEQDGIEAAIRFDPGEYSDVRAVKFLDEWLVPVASPSFMAAHPSIDEPARIPSNVMLHDTVPWEQAQDGEERNTWLGGMGLARARPSRRAALQYVSTCLERRVVGAGHRHGTFGAGARGLDVRALTALVRSRRRLASLVSLCGRAGKNTRLERIEAWLLNEGRLYRQQRNAWCEKNGVRMHVRA